MGRNVQAERIQSTCSQCSVGCGMEIVARGGSVLRVEGKWDAIPNGGLLCKKGRFDPLYDERERVTQPMVRKNGSLKAVSWDDALTFAALRLGSGRVGVLTSTNATNEALYVLKQVFLKGARKASIGLLDGAAPAPLRPEGKLTDIAHADLILVVGANPVVDQPVASYLIKRAADAGVPLVVVDGEENGLIPFASRVLALDEIAQAVDLAARAMHPMVVYGPAESPSRWSGIGDRFLCGGPPSKAIRALQELGAATFVALVPGVNTRAAVALGLSQGFDVGQVDTLYLLLGEEVWDGEGTMEEVAPGTCAIVQASYASPWTERAEVVLPMAIWSERSGSLTNLDGMVLSAKQAVDAEGEALPDWQILSQLAGKLGAKVAPSLEELTALATEELRR